MMLLPVNDVIRKHLSMIPQVKMILDGQCGQFNPVLLKVPERTKPSVFQDVYE